MNQLNTQLHELILSLVPDDGATIGNTKMLQALSNHVGDLEKEVYERARDELVDVGILGKGRGRGGSIFLKDAKAAQQGALRALGDSAKGALRDDAGISSVSTGGPRALDQSDGGDSDAPDLTLQMQEQPAELPLEQKSKPKTATKPRQKKSDQAEVLSYRHDEKRKNNPHVGMVDTASDGVEETTTWAYDPHLDPELQFDSSAKRAQVETLIDDALASGNQEQMKAALEELKRLQSPYLQWTGKAERTSFDVDTVSLHVHERIDPATILAAVQKRIRDSKGNSSPAFQSDLFHAPFENLPLREAIDFYKHERDWANRLIAGDSLLVMNSMLQKEGMAGQVQMIYIDPPYGIKYGSNFQPFTHKRDVKDRKDEDLTQEPEMIKAFRDTWELGIHSYLTYLRDRLLLARELLSDSGSVFVQISDENLHHVRELMDEVFGADNFLSIVSFTKAAGGLQASNRIGAVLDYIVWYSRDSKSVRYKPVYEKKDNPIDDGYSLLGLPGGYYRTLAKQSKLGSEIPASTRHSMSVLLTKPGPGAKYEVKANGNVYDSGQRWWGTTPDGLGRAIKSCRAVIGDKAIRLASFFDEFPYTSISNLWGGFGGAANPVYVVQTNESIVQRCLLMTTDPGDLVLDPTCGSGTTAYVAEKWGRRWVTCDTSRVAVTLAKQRLITASYDYFELKYPQEGLGGGFIYKTVPHITLKSIANNPEIDEIYEKSHPAIEQALTELNDSLQGQSPKGKPIIFIVTEGGRKGDKVDFSASDSKTVQLPSGETAKVNELLEWEVPFDFPDEWPEATKTLFDAFHSARQAMQQRMDESIANHAGQEVLYDQPQVSKEKLRITAPSPLRRYLLPPCWGWMRPNNPRRPMWRWPVQVPPPARPNGARS